MFNDLLAALVVVLCCLDVLIALENHSSRPGPNDLCRTVQRTSEKFNHSNRTMTFRCRPDDDCGGIGDRLGGIIGGAFYALMTERSFRIDWPGLDQVFRPGFTNWTFDADNLGVPFLNSKGEPLPQYTIAPKIGKIPGEADNGEITPQEEGSTAVGIVNDLNARQILNPSLVSKIEQYDHIFFHSNRGPNRKLYEKLQMKYKWLKVGSNVDEQYFNTFRCIFEGLFRPANVFLESSYKPVGREAIPFSKLIGIVEDAHHVGIAVHYRVLDNTAESDSSTAELIDEGLIAGIARKGSLYADQAHKKANLFFLTNGNKSAEKVLAHPLLKQTFEGIYVQELRGSKHINHPHAGGASRAQLRPSEVVSLQQAWRDWWIMYLSDVLIFANSGFSKSAALFASREQMKFENYVADRSRQPWVMCGNRFC